MLRVLVYLSLDPDRLATIAQIAGAYGISENHLMKVVQQLVRQGWVESVRGRSGGVRLAVEPDAIRVGEVVRAAQGDTPAVECLATDGGDCRITGACRLPGILGEALDAFYSTLDRYTVADLVTQSRPLQRTLGRIPLVVAPARPAATPRKARS